MKTIELKDLNRIIEINYSDFGNPRENDNLGTMVCFHGRYNLGDKHNYYSNDYNSFGEMKKAIIRKENVAVILPLYLYDHGNITISTSPFGCRFDSGQIGFIFISKEKVLKEFGGKIVTKKLKERITNYLISEITEYDKYISGEVFEFKVIDTITNEEIDSCCGFLGDTPDNGIYDYLNIEGLTYERYEEEYNNN